MKSEAFLRALGDIDDDLIMEAEGGGSRSRVPRRVRFAGAAAACVILAGAVLAAWPLLRETADNASMDMAAPEAEAEDCDVGDGALGSLSDQKGYSYSSQQDASGAPAPAETNIALDTEAGEMVTSWTFWYYDGKTWTTKKRSYPDGMPGLQGILNEYLASAGAEVRCTAVRTETVGEKDELLPGGIMQHTVGVRTTYITLDGDPGENILRGLVNTALNSGVSSTLYQVQIEMPGRTSGPHSAYSTAG